MFKVLTCLLVAGTVLAAPGPSAKLTSHLKSVLEKSESANIIVSFVGSNKAPLAQINNAVFADRNTRLNAVHDALVAHAQKSQQGVLELLSSSEHKVFWISNQIYVKAADAALIQKIAEDEHVESIDDEIIANLIEGMDLKHVLKQEQYEWGVVKIQAPEAWAHESFQDGDGVVIATVDTGVRGTHEALRDNFLGDYGWWDPSTRELTPSDRSGHGTHTTGTIAGSHGIGAAPGAKWAACRGCATSSCSQSDLLACAQFFACPTLADGTQPDCSKAPHLVSNSWGGGRENGWYDGAIDAYHAAGIIPLFSIGNSGPQCSTNMSPGDREHVIGVGSTTIEDAISAFSSNGPTSAGGMKPEISAPGSAVVSAYNTADDAYASLSGTSMACPHAAGVVALIKARNPTLGYSLVRSLLMDNADQELSFDGKECGGIPDSQFPNNIFGNGRVNALRSIQAVQALKKN